MSQADPIQTTRIVWGALLQSVVLYGVVLFVVDTEPQDLHEALPMVLSGLAVTLAPASLLARYTMLGTVGLTVPAVPSSPVRATREELAAERVAATARYQTATLLGCAIAEAIAILGFVLAFLSADPMQYLPFGVGSASLMALQFPRGAVRDAVMSDAARAAAAAKQP